ncbi:undecaprenyl-phosphate glucose phosphotransferase [Pseudorhodoferax sp. Leaf265]|jgi:putative colanic acid biosynthesis UDP-glucose lipid carrier transferase|uniref:undecaprenyl-phosphate glucose phosphotransferase n=1 Tax=Pseudorhodoferax sp. Leaf265 TaxID=1736315 RepID=UPI0006F20F67|nr:undecaprenyl-phosphate glucose phosphotransferase [Pseudorhodoferax sp. Leaf265]KQP21174.1 undecaprenyl-phosphate glucose phosphotransferase [Pseudorhodoferax sp. Leaf265]PZP95761.1 MAG: undecaprenyl-phosphate glucose phosphotransferase [Variovorax paradoxus]PZQ06715.1 MAG: undecaprenyl-phosphate glucose phosphotransferase [Variovorax paradoxus]
MDSSPIPLTQVKTAPEVVGGGSLGKDHPLSFIESLLDPGMLVLSLWGVGLYHTGSLRPEYLILSVIVFAMTFPGTTQIRSSLRKLVTQTLINWAAIAALLMVMGVATGYNRHFPVGALLMWLWLAPVSQIAAHRALRLAAPAILALRGPPRKAVIVGMNTQGVALARRIRETPYSQIEVSGFFDDRELHRLNAPMGFGLIDRLAALPAYVKANNVQMIYLSLPMASQPRILQVLDGLKDTTASIYFVPDMFVTDLIQGRSASVCGTPVISVCETPFRGTTGLVKRGWDILLASVILLLIAPVMLAVAIGIKLTSPGPIIFKQRRYGLDGKEIMVYKFRSMTVTEDGEKSYTQVKRGDARVTKIGAFIRKTSLDELPQFINVLQGRMSVVGPRPHAIAVNEQYRKLISGYMIRHKVRPGITGWAQVNGFRGGDDLESMQRRIEFDLDYLRNWSLRLDLYIIARTVGVVFKDTKAY